MMTTTYEDVGSNVLLRMKACGFDFCQAHPIEFYAILPTEAQARAVAGNFRGESTNARILPHDEGGWELQLSKVMYATAAGIDDFEQSLEDLVSPLGGITNGWGVTQTLASEAPELEL